MPLVALLAGMPFLTGCAGNFASGRHDQSPRRLEVLATAEPPGNASRAESRSYPFAANPLARNEPRRIGNVQASRIAGDRNHNWYPPIRTVAWQGNPPPPLPKTSDAIRVPLRKLPGSDDVELKGSKERINLKVRQAPLNAVLAVIAQQQGINIVAAGDVTDLVSVTLQDVPLQAALDSLMAIAGCTCTNRAGIIYVSKVTTNSTANPLVQGRMVRVIPLNFTSATDMEKAIKSLMSPVGKCFVQQSDPTDRRRTQERIVVEDIPVHLARIESYVAQVDQPPRQVLIEAHVLQVTLTDETRNGVNFEWMQKINGTKLTLAAVGFANPLASPASFFSIKGSQVNTLVELLQQTTDAKTLASPKVMVVNGQKAKLQIGERLGYLVTTTTQTSTLQNVNFLDVGVVLEVTPQITADGRVLMQVKPKVSNGQINQGLPQEQTTQVESTVMLSDGQGIVIGGLIQELDDDRQFKIPFLGDMWLIGRAFQLHLSTKNRKELIIALVPRIVPCDAPRGPREQVEWERSTTRLFHGPLLPEYRPWEPGLPDAMRDPRRPRFDRFPRVFRNLHESHPLPLDYYFPPASRNPHVKPTRLDEPIEVTVDNGFISYSRSAPPDLASSPISTLPQPQPQPVPEPNGWRATHGRPQP